MKWFNVTRSSGDPREAGEFVVEDHNGNEWLVRTNADLDFMRPAVCMNADYEAGIELEGDIFNAAREFMATEGC